MVATDEDFCRMNWSIRENGKYEGERDWAKHWFLAGAREVMSLVFRCIEIEL